MIHGHICHMILWFSLILYFTAADGFFFPELHWLRFCACAFRLSTRNLKAKSLKPASFNTPELNFNWRGDAFLANFFRSPIASSSIHPAVNRVLSPRRSRVFIGKSIRLLVPFRSPRQLKQKLLIIKMLPRFSTTLSVSNALAKPRDCKNERSWDLLWMVEILHHLVTIGNYGTL